MLCSIEHWPWIREAYQQLLAEREIEPPESYPSAPAINYCVDEKTLVFMLGELPYITAVYEQSRYEIADDAQQSAIDGVKRLLMSARSSYMADFGKRARRISPLLLSVCLKYIRNLT